MIKNLKARGFYTYGMSKNGRKEARKNLANLSKKDESKTIMFINKISKELDKNIAFVSRKNKGSYLNFGEIVEIDATEHWWNCNSKFNIYVAVDRATGIILALHAEKEETNQGYMILLEDLFSKWGFPVLIRTNKRRTFYGNEAKNTPL
ncbi:hypothetical protein [Mycoplasma zalophi]|uniref:hypothetical protein n=1 Tax=Mycoplasma zalophi TaxID=191287 RepID=UPI001C124576|nr:hypothetical protein [Mycoplasma zalophi]MBU4690831.1 hypothetical protein [Mycoplasma zalophi]